MSVVVDTNVLVVANGGHPAASLACIGACIDALMHARDASVVIDDAQLILSEYCGHCSLKGQPGLGDAFFKWLWDRQGNALKCRVVAIKLHRVRGFAEFPDDERLARFDRNDRKFVAVSIAAQDKPPVLNASDTDWWNVREVLAEHGIPVEFLCPELMRPRVKRVRG